MSTVTDGKRTASAERSSPLQGEWLTVAQLAAYLGISRSSIARLMQLIPHTKAPFIGIRFRRVDVDAYLNRHRVDPRSEESLACPNGMSLAHPGRHTDDGDDDEVVPGVTRAELKAKAGF